MFNILKSFILLIGSFFIFTSVCSAADVAKIGVVDIQRIIDLSDKGKEAQEELNKEVSKMFQEIKTKGEGLEKKKAKLEKESLVKSKEKREKEERALKNELIDFKELQRKYNDQANALQQKLMVKLHDAIIKLITDNGKKEGYMMILEKRAAGVLYAPSIDITDKIIKKYNTL